MKEHIKLYLLFAKQTIRGELVHRASFITGVIGQWISYGTTFITLYFLISNFGDLGGWKAEEVMFLYAFNLLSYAIAACVFFTPCINLPTKIRTGEFDGALIKPVNPFMHEIYNGFNFGYIGHTILSIIVIAITLPQTDYAFNIQNAFMFLIMLISSALIQASLLIAVSSISFITINENPVGDLIFRFKQFVDYPITIYSASIQIILTFVLPLAFLNFYPVTAILRTPSSPYLPDFVPYLTPLMAGLMFFLSIKAWNKGLSKYQSSGS
ncbi:ABC transporter permease [Scatolibacter rhodanostii]|uniref:ABC transporter permease n=1 Tax=Scatolibacter rhodanostii TaxID=2014781 RepID=UPI000C0755E0|nr:ABC-2 family transporter protein [Scatolibacter rhodanostii]